MDSKGCMNIPKEKKLDFCIIMLKQDRCNKNEVGLSADIASLCQDLACHKTELLT